MPCWSLRPFASLNPQARSLAEERPALLTKTSGAMRRAVAEEEAERREQQQAEAAAADRQRQQQQQGRGR